MKMFIVALTLALIVGCSWDMKGQGKGDVTRDDQGRVTGVSGSGDSQGTVKENE